MLFRNTYLLWLPLVIGNLFPRREKLYSVHLEGWNAVGAILKTQFTGDYAALVLMQKSDTKQEVTLHAPRGIAIVEVSLNRPDTKTIENEFYLLTAKMEEEMVQLAVVVISDDVAFLTAFAEWSLTCRLLVWSTRLIVLTRLQVHQVHHLQAALSFTNSLLLTPREDEGKEIRMQASAMLPYSRRDSTLVMATWAPQKDLSITSHLPLFPEKFDKLSNSKPLMVAMTDDSMHAVIMRDDPTVPGKKRIWYKGYMVSLMDNLAESLNFTFSFKPSPDGTWGAKLPSGRWTGMVGQVNRKEVDIGLGPFAMSPSRATVVDFTSPVQVIAVRVLAGRGNFEIDPWGFLLALGPMVWAATAVTLLLLPVIQSLLSYIYFHGMVDKNHWNILQLDIFGILVQEGVKLQARGKWWERVLMGVWILTTLVLAKSYEGNLMSLLAVRHVPQPFQSLRDVLDDPSITMIWEEGGSNTQLIIEAKSDIFREVRDSQKAGRLRYLKVSQYSSVLDEAVVPGRQVIIDSDAVITPLRSEHFSRTGRCSLYTGRESLISQPLALIGKNRNPLVLAMSKKVLSMVEAGLPDFWYYEGIANSTSCYQLPTKVTITSSFSLQSSLAMFMVLIGGLILAFVTFCVEMVVTEFPVFNSL